MSNAHKIIKNFTSDKFSPELKERSYGNGLSTPVNRRKKMKH